MKLLSKIVIIGTSLTLIGCGSPKERTMKTVQDIQDTLPNVVQLLNDIQTLETQLQTDWESEITKDPEMTTFAKGEGQVFDNINQRLEKLDKIKKHLNRLEKDNAFLKTVTDEQLPLSELQIINSQLEGAITELESYVKMSKPQLEQETEFFKSLSATSLTYDGLNASLVAVNERAAERQAILSNVSSTLATIDKPIRIVKARIEALNTNQ